VSEKLELEDPKDLRARSRKFLDLTNERKNMSTKTNFKRVALVAVAALGLGVLTSVAPANAAGEVTQTASGAGSSGIVSALSSNVATMTSAGQISLEVAAGGGSNVMNVQVTGGTFTSITSGGTINAAQTAVASAANTAIVGLIAKPTGVGTMVIKSWIGAVDASANETHTITVVASTSVGTLSTSKSETNWVDNPTTISNDGDGDLTNIDVVNEHIIANGQAGQIAYSLNDGNGVDLPATGVLSVVSSNPLIAVSFDGSFFNTEIAQATSSNYGSVYVAQAVANTPATGTITFKYNGTAYATKTAVLQGDIASIVVSDVLSGKTGVSGTVSGGTAYSADDAVVLANAGSFTFAVKDAAGNIIGGKQVAADTARYNNIVGAVVLDNSGNSIGYSSTALNAPGDGETVGTWTCPTTTAGSAKQRLSITNAANVKIYSNEFDAVCAGSLATYTASLDKAVYAPGDIATLTITAKSSAGTAPYSATTLGAGMAILGSQLTAVTAPTTVDTFDAGVAKYKYVVGTTEGSYALVVDLPAYVATDAAKTISYKVAAAAGAVSNADVLKAIVSLIASINKQIAALQKALLKR
jgi:trimeric autotransporter adhesin